MFIQLFCVVKLFVFVESDVYLWQIADENILGPKRERDILNKIGNEKLKIF